VSKATDVKVALGSTDVTRSDRLARPRAPGPDRRTATPPVRVTIAVITLFLMPFPVILHGWGPPSYDYDTILFPVDLAFAALLLVGLRPFVVRLRSRQVGAGTSLWALLAVVMSLAWVAHPSLRGAHVVFELWATAVLAATIVEALTTGWASLVVGVVGGIAVMETVWATIQLATGSGLGLGHLGEIPDPFYHFSPSVEAPMGSMVHIYVLASLALTAGGVLAWRSLTARQPLPWVITAAVAIVPVGFTYSRAGLLAGLLMIAGLLVGACLGPRLRGTDRARYARAALALGVGIAIPAAIWHGGWDVRANQTTGATNAAQLTTDRTYLDHEAIKQIESYPFTGVGPGRYIASLKARYGVEPNRAVGIFKPVHNIPLLITAEGGLVAGIVIVAVFAAVGWGALLSGPAAIALYLMFLPFAMLDHLDYTYPQGLVLTAIWLAVLDHLRRSHRSKNADRAGRAEAT
jgi:hypothetical protein